MLAVTASTGCTTASGGGEPGSQATRGSAEAQASQPKTPSPSELEKGLQAVLAANDMAGNPVATSPAKPAGDKRATAIVVFASWCQPCRKELAILGELRQKEPGLRVIGVNYYEEFDQLSDEERLRSFLRESAPWLQVVRADEALFAALGRPSKIPTVYLFDGQGKLVEAYLRSQRDPPGKAELEADVARALL